MTEVSGNLTIVTVPQHSHLLGRQQVHDERSRGFARNATVNRAGWKDKSIRIYDPIPNPNQPVGCCTGVAKSVQFNASGNRKPGVTLRLDDALNLYRRSSQIDPWEGSWEPDDTGSSGLASAKAAIELYGAGEYRWLFGGADEVVQAIMGGQVVSVGTWWYEAMFTPGRGGVVKPEGDMAGGHQWAVRGYDVDTDRLMGRCWWGPQFRDFWIARTDLDALLRDGGDAHVQRRS